MNRLLPLALLLIAPALPARAQEASRGDTALASDASTLPDIELTASVEMQSLQFSGEPRVQVTLLGDAARSAQDTQRRGLPTPVVAGTTYRNVGVRTHIHVNVFDALAAPGTSQPADPPSRPSTPEDVP